MSEPAHATKFPPFVEDRTPTARTRHVVENAAFAGLGVEIGWPLMLAGVAMRRHDQSIRATIGQYHRSERKHIRWPRRLIRPNNRSGDFSPRFANRLASTA